MRGHRITIYFYQIRIYILQGRPLKFEFDETYNINQEQTSDYGFMYYYFYEVFQSKECPWENCWKFGTWQFTPISQYQEFFLFPASISQCNLWKTSCVAHLHQSLSVWYTTNLTLERIQKSIQLGMWNWLNWLNLTLIKGLGKDWKGWLRKINWGEKLEQIYQRNAFFTMPFHWWEF